MEPQSKYSSLTDIELIRLYKETDDKAIIGLLYKRYTHLVMGVCMIYFKDEDESKDAVMEIFEKLMQDLHRHEISYFKGWLHTVTKNHCLMKFRARKNKIMMRNHTEATNLKIVEMNSLWHPDASEKETMLQLLEKGITQLNEGQRKCVELFYLGEKSYQEIAELTGYSMLNVKSYIQNGKRNLKIFIEKNHGRES